jgi:hypothetical protein
MDGHLERVAQPRTQPGHLSLVLEGRETLMPLKMVSTFELSCDNCDYVADMEEGEVMLFETPEAATAYAVDSGWKYANAGEIRWFSCPGCEGN